MVHGWCTHCFTYSRVNARFTGIHYILELNSIASRNNSRVNSTVTELSYLTAPAGCSATPRPFGTRRFQQRTPSSEICGCRTRLAIHLKMIATAIAWSVPRKHLDGPKSWRALQRTILTCRGIHDGRCHPRHAVGPVAALPAKMTIGTLCGIETRLGIAFHVRNQSINWVPCISMFGKRNKGAMVEH